MFSRRRTALLTGMVMIALLGLVSISTLPFLAALLEDRPDVITWFNSFGGGAEEEEKKGGQDYDLKITGQLADPSYFLEHDRAVGSDHLFPAYLFHPEILTPPPESMMIA